MMGPSPLSWAIVIILFPLDDADDCGCPWMTPDPRPGRAPLENRGSPHSRAGVQGRGRDPIHSLRHVEETSITIIPAWSVLI
jgi:hypothetical protein